MTLKNSYSSYFKNTFKRKSWNIALSSLLFFFTLTLPALMIMGENTNKSMNQNENINIFNRVCERLTSLMDYRGNFIKIAFILLAIISAISAFNYLHNKAKVDFYHSFSISRKAMFTFNYVASIIPAIIGFVVNFIITNALIASFGYGQALMTVEIYKALAENILFFISTFSIVSLCTILCGNTVITLVLTSVAFFGQGAIVALIKVLKYFLYPTYYFDTNEAIKFALKLSPVTQIFNSYSNGIADSRLFIFISYLVITAIIIAVSLTCFIKRKSENTGIAIAFEKFKLPLKIYCCIIFGLGFAVLLRTIVNQNMWIYFGLVLGILVAHALSEIAFDFSFSSILKNWKHGIILIVASCAIVLGMNFDITGFNSRVIKADKVASFGLDLQRYNYNNNESFKKRGLNHPENVEAITEIIKRASTFDRNSIIEQIYFEVAVEKKPIGIFKRSYSLPKTDENIALINKIRYSEEYKKYSNKIFSDKVCKAKEVTIQSRTSSSQNDFKVITGDKVQKVLKALHSDYLKLKVEEGLNTIPVFVVTFKDDEVKRNEYYDYNQTFPIYQSYTETLELIKQYTGVTVKQLEIEKIVKITMDNSTIENIKEQFDKSKMSDDEERATRYHYSGVANFTEKADIEKLIKNAVPSHFTSYMDSFGSDSNYYGIEIYFKNETEPQHFVTSNDDIYKVIAKE